MTFTHHLFVFSVNRRHLDRNAGLCALLGSCKLRNLFYYSVQWQRFCRCSPVGPERKDRLSLCLWKAARLGRFHCAELESLLTRFPQQPEVLTQPRRRSAPGALCGRQRHIDPASRPSSLSRQSPRDCSCSAIQTQPEFSSQDGRDPLVVSLITCCRISNIFKNPASFIT